MSKSLRNPEFWKLIRHLIFGGIIILLVSVILLQILKKQRDYIIEQSNISVVSDLSLVLALSGEPITGGSLRSRSEWSKLSAFAPYSEQEILTILSHKSLVISVPTLVTLTLPHDVGTLSIFDDSIQKAIHFDTIYLQFLNSKKISKQLKRKVIDSTCCLQVSDYPNTANLNNTSVNPQELASHVFVKGKGYGFLWSLDDGDKLFIQTKYGLDYEIFIIISVIAIAMVGMLLMVWQKLKKVEQSLYQKGVSLSDGTGVLRELNSTYDSMSSHNQRLLKIQREMINAISHELRTPIARLRFGLEVIKDEVVEADILTISALEDDIEELNSLVDEVLTYGKLEEGSLSLHFEKINMKKLIDAILQHNELLLSHLTMKVNCDEKTIVRADIHHLHRALQNLILNAAKYAHTGVLVEFQQLDDLWQVSIEDDGPGIALEDREKIFIPFHRLDDSRTRASGGYGLGLAIVQRIAFWHGGTVSVEEGSTGGAKFIFSWSRWRQHQQDLL